MSFVYLDSFVYAGGAGDAAQAAEARTLETRWDLVPATDLPCYVIGPQDTVTSIDFKRWALELGNGAIQKITKTIPLTSEAVFGGHWAWGGPVLSVSIVINFKDIFQATIASIHIVGGQMEFYNGGTLVKTLAHGLSSTSNIGAKIEIYCKRHASLGKLEVAINGLLLTNISFQNFGDNDIEGIQIGSFAQTGGFAQQVNDLYIRDVSDFSPAFTVGDYVGDWTIFAKSPKTVDFDNLVTNATDALDPKSGDEDSSFALAGSIDSEAQYNYWNHDEDFSSNVVGADSVYEATSFIAVQTRFLLRKDGTEPLTYTHSMLPGGLEANRSETANIQATSVDLKYTTHIIDEHPVTTNPLTEADVDDMTCGFKITDRGL